MGIEKNNQPKYTNLLFLETSPYLLQHAHNPVNWYPWGDEAFDAAKKLNRPVLLSIGYSTCHWCHVMEEESFEDVAIAKYLNENYIAIKVDREERPDIDSIYMKAVQALTGGGGWPLTVWLTPDKKPFYGGTYLPARDGDRGAATGFLTILKKITDAYRENHIKILESSLQLTDVIRRMAVSNNGHPSPDEDILKTAAAYYQKNFDPVNGGIDGAPKFPSSLPVRFLLQYHQRIGDPKILEMATETLGKMARGGIYDHVGGGFHRYATDSRWRVPHFEKMLYDNALLVMAYLEGYQVTGYEDYKRIVSEILDYIGQEMTSPGGAFYSATDADSLTPGGLRKEGYYFTWTIPELIDTLGRNWTDIAKKHFSVGETPDFEGRHILHVTKPVAEMANVLGFSEDVLNAILRKVKNKLYQARRLRALPFRDDKILTSWNGLMISALSRAGLVLKNEDYIRRAVVAAEFILQNMTIKGRLRRSFKDGRVGKNAFLQDYAFFISALIDLYEATHRPHWLKTAINFDAVLEKHFEDRQNGGFYMTGDDHENLLVREKPSYDGAVPSGNSVAVQNLFRLSAFTTDDHYRQRAEKTLSAFSDLLKKTPAALANMLVAVDANVSRLKEIIIVTPEGKPHLAGPFLKVLRKNYLPNRILIVTESGEKLERLSAVTPLVKDKTAINGETTAYVCEKGVCRLPVHDPAELMTRLQI